MAASECEGIPVAVISGPTAVGKSKLAVELAVRLGAEIISADSMQIYKGLDIGTAKITMEERRGIPHHMIDIIRPDVVFSVKDYVEGARRIIDKNAKNKKPSIICGGTGLYISSLIKGINFYGVYNDDERRKLIESEYDPDGGAALFSELEKADRAYAGRIHVNDRKRVVRAIEMLRANSTPSAERQRSMMKPFRLNPFNIILLPCERAVLYDRINARTDKMLENGLVEEARYVYENRDSFLTASQAIGYKELFPFFEAERGLPECIEQLKRSSRRYAKRQITWFSKLSDGIFMDFAELDIEMLAAKVKNHLKI